MASPQSLIGVIEAEFGNTIVLTVKEDDVAVDISSYTTRTVEFRKPASNDLSLTVTATFTTDGTNGQLDLTFADNDIDEEGLWKGQVVLLKTGVEARSEIFHMPVGEQI